jgi:hypothetical protein
MKTAKEWAESAVTDTGWILDKDAAVAMSQPSRAHVARGIMERLVERVQADARAPLEEEISRLRAENDRLNAKHVEYRAFVADANDMLAEEHEQIRKANQ